ncbi:MAG: YebC/PmpR family DNA-binding transcriptional regulator [Candidatus Saccharimonadales bacterium]
MSGHSKWSTIKREKGAKDAKRGAVFTKLGNQIAIAARGGTDSTLNSSLALAIEKAKASNMPMNNIQRAIDRVSDKSVAQLEEIIYEGYGPGGVAIIVEAATDNKNRTYPEVRHAFSKCGGAVAEPGSVLFQFARRGVITIALSGDSDELLLQVLDAGAEDAIIDNDEMIIYVDMKDLHTLRRSLADVGLTIRDAGLQYVANTTVPLTDSDTEDKLFRLLDTLDDLDDVTNVYNNATFSHE